MIKQIKWLVVLVVFVLTLVAVPVLAQGMLPQSWTALVSGGGSSAGGNYRLDDAIGLSIAAGPVASGGGFRLDEGFAPVVSPLPPPADVSKYIYLPTVAK